MAGLSDSRIIDCSNLQSKFRKDEARERTLVIYMGQSEAMYTLQTVWTGCVYLMACNLLVESVSSTERTWTETHHTTLYIHNMYM